MTRRPIHAYIPVTMSVMIPPMASEKRWRNRRRMLIRDIRKIDLASMRHSPSMASSAVSVLIFTRWDSRAVFWRANC